MGIQTLRSIESTALRNNGRISTANATELLGALQTSKAPEQDKAVLRDMLARDRFDPAARTMLEKKVGKPAEKSGLVDAELGKATEPGSPTKVNISVAREIGPTEGFGEKFQALGAARASGLPNTAVVKVGDKWHAVQTNIAIPKSGLTPGKGMDAVVAMPPAPTKDDYLALKKEVFQAQAAVAQPVDFAGGGLPKTDAQRAADQARLDVANQNMVGAALGVEPKEVNILKPGQEPKPDQINFMENFPKSKGACCPGHDNAGAYFGNKNGNAEGLTREKNGPDRSRHGMVFGPDPFTDPVKAAGVLAHEATHKQDHDLAEKLRGGWKTATDTGKTKLPFGQWVSQQQTHKKISEGARDAVLEQLDTPQTTQTEGNAYTQELLATYANSPVGDKNIKGTINMLLSKKGGFDKVEIAKLKAFATTLDKEHREDFKKQVLDRL